MPRLQQAPSGMYVAYAYAMPAECIGRGGMIYLLSTAAQSFAEYEVWHVEGAWLFLIVSGMTIDVGWISLTETYFVFLRLERISAAKYAGTSWSRLRPWTYVRRLQTIHILS